MRHSSPYTFTKMFVNMTKVTEKRALTRCYIPPRLRPTILFEWMKKEREDEMKPLKLIKKAFIDKNHVSVGRFFKYLLKDKMTSWRCEELWYNSGLKNFFGRSSNTCSPPASPRSRTYIKNASCVGYFTSAVRNILLCLLYTYSITRGLLKWTRFSNCPSATKFKVWTDCTRTNRANTVFVHVKLKCTIYKLCGYRGKTYINVVNGSDLFYYSRDLLIRSINVWVYDFIWCFHHRCIAEFTQDCWREKLIFRRILTIG